MDIASWDSDKNLICPRCNVVEETFHHIFQCKSSHASTSHKKALIALKEGLRRIHTAPIIQRTIVKCIDRHRKGYANLRFTDIIVDDDTKDLARTVFRNQDKLGTTAILQGYLSTDWSILQNVHDGCKDITDANVNWASRVIKLIWKYSVTLWKDRCEEIHGKQGNKTNSLKQKELLTSLQSELDRTKYFGDFEIRQLCRNIQKSMNNSQTNSLQLWLDTIRAVKESKIMLRRENQIRNMRSQSITRFLLRPAQAP